MLQRLGTYDLLGCPQGFPSRGGGYARQVIPQFVPVLQFDAGLVTEAVARVDMRLCYG